MSLPSLFLTANFHGKFVPCKAKGFSSHLPPPLPADKTAQGVWGENHPAPGMTKQILVEANIPTNLLSFKTTGLSGDRGSKRTQQRVKLSFLREGRRASRNDLFIYPLEVKAGLWSQEVSAAWAQGICLWWYRFERQKVPQLPLYLLMQPGPCSTHFI